MYQNYLTEDLITDILIRVSAKNLARFTCVSKSWRSLIHTDPYLSRLQRTDLLDRPCLIVEEYTQSVAGIRSHYNYWIDLESIEDQSIIIKEIHCPFDRAARVLASCHDLLLLKRYDCHNNIAVYNLITRKHVMVPPNPAGDDNVVFFGFGYDRVHHCYKLLTRVKHRDQSLELMVYDLDKGTWKRLQFGMWWQSQDWYSDRNRNLYRVWDDWDATCVDGGLFRWIGGYRFTTLIACFLLAEEEFHVLKLPDLGQRIIFYPNMSVFDGRLCLVRREFDTGHEFWTIDMDCDDDGKKQWRWTKLLKIPNFTPIDNMIIPVCFSLCKNKILILSDEGEGQLLWYDIAKKEFNKIRYPINGRWLVSRRPFVLSRLRKEGNQYAR